MANHDTTQKHTASDLADNALRDIDKARSDRMLNGPIHYPILYRGGLLLIVMAGGLLVGGQVERFEESLEALIVLAFFIPVVMDMGGNIGTQSTTAFARGFTLGHVSTANLWRMVGRELVIGLVLGVVMGIIGGIAASLWQGDPSVGLAVGGALALGLPIATTIGFLIPYGLLKIGVDHVPASDPIMTTVKDFTMVTIYFSLAAMLIGIDVA
ncbi:magnesium transporter [Halorhodospira halophila]|uniref:MgtE integral membrane region n=1 Tax=Halorhodospira halophila (strain DSM 244 / SL1) TaxID=349124 RepID=A1WWM0_HALHL|nr:magnesium transporter [Halorhodospira halophila]ABM62082.1 MgtE integral membrane region [Halorhodospira halophila SL1]MBK1729410.1 magnesium transporter [Halorhodospira halophila]